MQIACLFSGRAAQGRPPPGVGLVLRLDRTCWQDRGVSSPLLQSLLAALAHSPDDVVLRLHVAELYVEDGATPDAVAQCAEVLRRQPGHPDALALLARLSRSGEPEPAREIPQGGYNWEAAEDQVGDIVAPAFTDGPVDADEPDVVAAGVTLADVAGLSHVKERVELAFLTPMRNPEIGRLYAGAAGGGAAAVRPSRLRQDLSGPGAGRGARSTLLCGEPRRHPRHVDRQQ